MRQPDARKAAQKTWPLILFALLTLMLPPESRAQDVEARLYATGGTTTVEGVGRRDFQANTRVGATFALPLARRHNLKFTWSSGVSTRVGGDFDNFALSYFYNW